MSYFHVAQDSIVAEVARIRDSNLESWATIGSSEEHHIYLREKDASFITNVEREGIRI